MPEPLYLKMPPGLGLFVMGWARGDAVMALALLAAMENHAAGGSVRRVALEYGVGEWRLRRWYRRCLRDLRRVGANEHVDAGKYRLADSVRADFVRELHAFPNRVERQ